MRKFIPLSTFKEIYSNQSDLLTEEGMNSFREKLASSGIEIAEKARFTSEEFSAFQETLRDPSNVVFYGWIEQVSALKNALLGKKPSLFIDSAKHLDHTLSEKYTQFLSPVLSEVLLSTHIESDNERKIAFSFVQLLDERHRAVVESKLFQPYQDRLEELKSISDQTTSEQELVNIVKPLCSDDIIASVNYLSRASYASKLGYVDKILNAIHSKACTVRFANWILERMSHIDLNDEHLYKLTDLRKDLRKGNLKVKNHKKGTAPIPMRGVLTGLIITLLVGSVIYLIIFKPFSKVEENEFSNNTSFKEFTKEERIRMDSLLKEMDNPFEVVDSLDPLFAPVQTGVDIDLILRKAFKNERMEAIYEDLMADVDLKFNYPDSSCSDFKNTVFKSTNSVKSLDFMTGVHASVVRNESEYDIILYVAEGGKEGKVFASLIKPNETLEFKMNKYHTLMVVAGNSYQPFVNPSKATEEEQPSAAFTHHFCDTDLNYQETINTSYKFMYPRQGKNKFMIMGAKSGYVHLVDVHGVLEAY
ncbi:MAG: hypothetical protein P8P74_13275 [Crocinitomicaceae bacterium]|nr:hypothetical protein [Crocinitomicaceae bacterium]